MDNAIIKPIFHKMRRTAANLWLNRLKSETTQIGITGSYGKTSTTHAISAVLAAHTPIVSTDVDLDTIFNVPITALKLRDEAFIIFELGIDSRNEMDFHLEIAHPTIGVMTGITPVHSDKKHLGSLEALIKEKRKLLEALPANGTALLHYDDSQVRAMTSSTAAEVLWYGMAKECHYRAENIRVQVSGSRFTAVTPKQTLDIETPLLGAHSCVNLLAAIAIGEIAGVSAAKMQAAFAELQPLQGRLNVEPGPLGTILINDALRANPASTRAGLEFLDALPTTSRKIAVLGEMGELGEHAVAKHAEIGQAAADARIDLLVTVGNLTDHIAAAARTSGMPVSHIQATGGVHEAAAFLSEHTRPGDLLYLKGSLMRHLERIRLLLEGERVGCQVISCPFYHQCEVCQYREVGYEG